MKEGMTTCRGCKAGELTAFFTRKDKSQFSKCRIDHHYRLSDKERICPHGHGWIHVVCQGKCGDEVLYRPDNPCPPKFCRKCGGELVKKVAQ